MDRVILGVDCIYPAESETGINSNVLVCGDTGSGKTMSFTEPCLLHAYSRSKFIIASKRRIVEKYAPVLKKRGYDVPVVDFVHPMAGTEFYDPLMYISNESDISFLARSIVLADPQKRNSRADPYWDQSAASLLCALITYVMLEVKRPSFNDVLNMLDALVFREKDDGIVTSLDPLFDELEEKKAKLDVGFAMRSWHSFSMLPKKTAGCVYATLMVTIDKIFTHELRMAMKKKRPVELRDLGQEKTALFVITSPVNPALHDYVSVFYGQMFKELFELAEAQPGGKLPIPVDILGDDFATGARIQNFAEYISILREKNISVSLLIQSESQLVGLYGEADATTIINNCSSYVYMGSMDLNTARNMSHRVDMPLEDILYMPIGKEIVIRRGQRPIMTERYDIRSDKLYQELPTPQEETDKSNAGKHLLLQREANTRLERRSIILP